MLGFFKIFRLYSKPQCSESLNTPTFDLEKALSEHMAIRLVRGLKT